MASPSSRVEEPDLTGRDGRDRAGADPGANGAPATPVLRRSSLADVAYTRIKAEITNHRFRPGKRMREVDLADWLGISRTPVRDALSQLLAEGLLEAAPRRGLIISSLSAQQVSEIYAVRDILDGLAGALAARHASLGEIAVLRELLARQRETPAADTTKLQRLNQQFHQVIYLAARNRYLIASINALQTSLALLEGTTYAAAGRPEEALQQHTALVDAIEARDDKLASHLASAHMRSAEGIWLRMLTEGLTSTGTAAWLDDDGIMDLPG